VVIGSSLRLTRHLASRVVFFFYDARDTVGDCAPQRWRHHKTVEDWCEQHHPHHNDGAYRECCGWSFPSPTTCCHVYRDVSPFSHSKKPAPGVLFHIDNTRRSVPILCTSCFSECFGHGIVKCFSTKRLLSLHDFACRARAVRLPIHKTRQEEKGSHVGPFFHVQIVPYKSYSCVAPCLFPGQAQEEQGAQETNGPAFTLDSAICISTSAESIHVSIHP
jgi:hypothetical protein